MARMKVRYVGVTSDFRGITEQDLEGWGIKVDLPAASPLARSYIQRNTWGDDIQRPLDPGRDLVWGPHNNHALELDVSPDLEQLLRQQGHFVLTEVKDSGQDGETVAEPTDITHPGDRQVAREPEKSMQASETFRAESPADLDRPDPVWQAMQASEAEHDHDSQMGTVEPGHVGQ